MKYDIEISSDDIDSPSPTGVFTLNVHSCSVKEEEWAVQSAPMPTTQYNIRNPTESPLIATLDYKGPKGNDFVNCDDPVFTVTDAAGVAISFLTANYDSADDKIYITSIDGAEPGIPE